MNILVWFLFLVGLCVCVSAVAAESDSRDAVDVCVERVENDTLTPSQRCHLAHTAVPCQEAFGGADRPIPLNYFAILTCALPENPVGSVAAAFTWLTVLAAAALAIAAVLFALSTTAEDHFCPTLSHLSSSLSLSQSLAGVTLLAFGNGSADVFAAIAAVRAGKGDLALASITGAGLFVTGAVVGAIGTTARPAPEPSAETGVTPKLRVIALDASNTARDAGWYTVTLVVSSLVILIQGEVSLVASLALFFTYVGYVLVVLRTERRRAKERAAASAAAEEESRWLATESDDDTQVAVFEGPPRTRILDATALDRITSALAVLDDGMEYGGETDTPLGLTPGPADAPLDLASVRDPPSPPPQLSPKRLFAPDTPAAPDVPDAPTSHQPHTLSLSLSLSPAMSARTRAILRRRGIHLSDPSHETVTVGDDVDSDIDDDDDDDDDDEDDVEGADEVGSDEWGTFKVTRDKVTSRRVVLRQSLQRSREAAAASSSDKDTGSPSVRRAFAQPTVQEQQVWSRLVE